MDNEIKVVIGSWGSYNECNERSLGSKWLTLNDFESYEEIEEELKKEGFELDGIDEELFIQDIEGISADDINWDYMHPETLFNTLYEAGIFKYEYMYKEMEAFLEVRSWKEFVELVESKSTRWDDDINLFEEMSWADYGEEYYRSCYGDVPNGLDNFIDWEGYGKYIGSDYAEEYSNGIIEIVR